MKKSNICILFCIYALSMLFLYPSTAKADSIEVEGSNAATADLYVNSSNPQPSSDLGALRIFGNDSAASKILYAAIQSRVADSSQGSQDAKLEFYAMVAGALTKVMEAGSDGLNILTGGLNVDANTLFVDAANDRVGVGLATPSEKLQVAGNAAIGAAAAGVDYALKFKGESNNGNITWMEDEARFDFSNTALIPKLNVGVTTGSLNNTIVIQGPTRSLKMGLGILSYETAVIEADQYFLLKNPGMTIDPGASGVVDINPTGGNAQLFLRGTGNYAFIKPQTNLFFRAENSSGVTEFRNSGNTGLFTISDSAVTIKAAGLLAVQNRTDNPAPISGSALLWSTGIGAATEMKVTDAAGNITGISPHQFSLYQPDSADPLPWSYSSENAFIGKKINVDMSGAIRELEKLSGKKFIHTADLPPEEKIDFEDWQTSESVRLALAEMQAFIDQNPRIEIPLSEALEQVDELADQVVPKKVKKFRLNAETGAMDQYEVSEPETVQVPTGKKKFQFKEGVEFDENTGKVYRQRTVSDVPTPQIAKIEPPQYLKARLPKQEAIR